MRPRGRQVAHTTPSHLPGAWRRRLRLRKALRAGGAEVSPLVHVWRGRASAPSAGVRARPRALGPRPPGCAWTKPGLGKGGAFRHAPCQRTKKVHSPRLSRCKVGREPTSAVLAWACPGRRSRPSGRREWRAGLGHAQTRHGPWGALFARGAPPSHCFVAPHKHTIGCEPPRLFSRRSSTSVTSKRRSTLSLGWEPSADRHRATIAIHARSLIETLRRRPSPSPTLPGSDPRTPNPGLERDLRRHTPPTECLMLRRSLVFCERGWAGLFARAQTNRSLLRP